MSAVISMTTIPSRITYLGRCVEGLVAQGLPVYVWLPRYVERIGGGFNDVPAFLREMDVHVEIIEDRGPASKLLFALERFDTVITGDDDCIYGEGWADGLLEWAKKRPDAALGYRGRRFDEDLQYSNSQAISGPNSPRPVHLITSSHGQLYRREFFDDSIFEEWRECPQNDDIVFGAHLWRKDIPMLVIPRHFSLQRTKAKAVDPLYATNTQKNRNDEFLSKLYLGWEAR